ncbi:PREDICTED: actin-related protein 2/3 complex subunit 1A [Ceratosolen solmsi marchali]|uniref:Actin-related protein 2/3 complex subunit n=1 Tax=Ceratosolen solmsi marchali TaxID=326594 RepID=A0AAJ6YHP6_9HYME|nr:PREDICTED: actin-related protein 2/3 complex subunit 1A [Ceratosolen solmsi marchali]
MTEVYNLGLDAVTCHVWNEKHTEIALCPNNNEVYVYKQDAASWKLSEILQEHDQRIMGIDWAPKTNRIVTCAADKTAYVWSQNTEGKWIPSWVLLRTNRAATCVKWSPNEDKLAVGSGDRVISVCYFASENNWWVSKHIKKPLRSTVTAIDWHPDNKVLAAGSTDYKIRVFSAYVRDIDNLNNNESSWGNSTILGTLFAEFFSSGNGGGWVHDVAFSPCGTKLCWVGHNSSICIADSLKGNVVNRLFTEYLPFLRCVWLDCNFIITAGHDCMPMVYKVDESGKLSFATKLDNTQKKEAAGLTAMRKFQSLDRQARTEINDSAVDSIHQNTITCIRKLSKSRFSTSSLDGLLVVWDIKTPELMMNSLRIN